MDIDVCRPGQRLSVMIRVRLAAAMTNVIVSFYAIVTGSKNFLS
jgi:hypothetical protein